ncbi:MAG: hypothetical protein AB1410_04815 [Acidobacteriota bacterium]
MLNLLRKNEKGQATIEYLVLGILAISLIVFVVGLIWPQIRNNLQAAIYNTMDQLFLGIESFRSDE